VELRRLQVRTATVAWSCVLIALGCGMGPMAMQSAEAATGNLIPNPSVETPNGAGTAPLSWVASRWGTNTTTLGYDTVGAVDGARAVSVNVTSYVDGAAEWYFSPVAVKPGTTYTYEDSWRASVPTEIGALVTSSTGVQSYQYIATLPASFEVVSGGQAQSAITMDAYEWDRSTLKVTTPPGAASMTILHVVYSKGMLQADNFSLTEGIPMPVPAPSGAELVKNSGAETASGVNPATWSQNAWGTNTSRFSWVSGGAHSGTKSLRVEVTSHQSGDAKWLFQAVPVTGGKYYTFSDWYKSTASTAVSLGYARADGSSSWANVHLGVATATNWTQFKAGLTVPKDAVVAYFAHFLPGKGVLQTDDYSMKEAGNPPGFRRPLISLTFDDASASQYTAVAKMDTYGFASTQYVPTGGLGSEGIWTRSQVKSVFARGHEIGSHSVTHPDLTTVSAAKLGTELASSKTTLTNIVGEGQVMSFATPYGAYNANVIAAVKAAGYTNHRSVDVGYNTKSDLDPYNIKVQNMLATTTTAEFQDWVDTARAGNYWLVVVYHGITDNLDTGDPGDAYSTTPALFEQQLNVIRRSGLAVVRVDAALKELAPQIR
jgi:peptidoglycan/xylan/chitin deacetylase (PgdA/CDA1 family)